MTGDFFFMPAFNSITSYPIVKISRRIKGTWVSVFYSRTEHDQETDITVIGYSDMCC
jgi:hypothetical protein